LSCAFQGTSALKVEASDKQSILDDILGTIFQIGGKLIFPNDGAGAWTILP
jgi:hypothetical protein